MINKIILVGLLAISISFLHAQMFFPPCRMTIQRNFDKAAPAQKIVIGTCTVCMLAGCAGTCLSCSALTTALTIPCITTAPCALATALYLGAGSAIGLAVSLPMAMTTSWVLNQIENCFDYGYLPIDE